jgi:hypothetical protein
LQFKSDKGACLYSKWVIDGKMALSTFVYTKNSIMKYLVFFISIFSFAGCTQNNTPAIGDNAQEITETILPKGKYVLDDDVKASTTNPAALNGINNSGAAADSKTDTPADEVKNLKRRFKNLLVFHANDTMKINKSYLATLILGKDQVLGDLKAEVTEQSNASAEDIKQDTTLEIGTKMRARLIDMSGAGNKGFSIELIGGEEAATQSINAKRKKIIWQWKLTPQTPGLQELKLSINVIEKDGQTVNLPARNIPVVIFAAEEGMLSSVGSFFKNDNTKWILSAILIPIFIAWFSTRMKNKANEKRGDGRRE